MADVNLPLSGPVTQAFEQWTSFFSPSGNQVSLFSVNVGQSSDETTEKAVIANVASYGKQLGRIGDALRVLIKNLPLANLSDEDKETLCGLESLLHDIDKEKARQRTPLHRPGRGSTTAKVGQIHKGPE